jgi:hypothetical protein
VSSNIFEGGVGCEAGGVVDEHIHAAHKLVQLADLGDICHKLLGTTARSLDLPRNFHKARSVATDQGDLRATGREFQGDRTANTAASTGDESAVSGQFVVFVAHYK